MCSEYKIYSLFIFVKSWTESRSEFNGLILGLRATKFSCALHPLLNKYACSVVNIYAGVLVLIGSTR